MRKHLTAVGMAALGLACSAAQAVAVNASAGCAGGQSDNYFSPGYARSFCQGSDNGTPDSANFEGDVNGLHAAAYGNAGGFVDIYDDVVAAPLIMPGLLGQAGSVTISTHYDGLVTVGTRGFVQIYNIDPGQQSWALAFQQLFGVTAPLAVPVSVAGTASLNIPIFFGQSFELGTLLQVSAGPGEVDFGDTAMLVGLQAFDSQDNPVQASFISVDGTDWGAIAANNAATLPPSPGSTGLPLPATLWLVLLALPLMPGPRRNQRAC